MSTLPLYWKLSSSEQDERIDASVELISSLQQFQLDHVPEPYLNGASHPAGDSPEEDGEKEKPSSYVESMTSEDVQYALRRLTRGLASPKESSRLGFAVALTELLSRLSVVTTSQVIKMVYDASELTNGIKGQQLRDFLFARLFGLNCIVQSGLLYKAGPLQSSTVPASTLKDFQKVVREYIGFGKTKTWLRPTAWWSLLEALEALHSSQVPWREEAVQFAVAEVFKDTKEWSPEKVAAAVKLQKWFPDLDWANLLSPAFKDGQILSPTSLVKVATILREVRFDGNDEDGLKSSRRREWQPELHFAWDALIEQYFDETDPASRQSSIHEFFRITVDESLFSNNATPERRFWGFMVFRKILARADAANLPQLFTQNFARTWMNNLAGKDKVLNKVAREVVNDLKVAVEKNSQIGFNVVMALLGSTDGKFDRLSQTKLVDSILGSMDPSGVKTYVDYLIDMAYKAKIEESTDADSINAQRKWVVEQLSSLIRNQTMPRDDAWILAALQFLILHGLFQVKKKNKESEIPLLHRSSSTVFLDDMHALCRKHLDSCLAFLATRALPSKGQPSDGQRSANKTPGLASDGETWLSKTINTIQTLEEDRRHVSLLREESSEDTSLRKRIRKLLKQVGKKESQVATGIAILLQSYQLRTYGEEFEHSAALDDVLDASAKLLELEKSSSKSKAGTSQAQEESLEPIDVIVDSLIGDLESESSYQRDVANLVFDHICQDFKDSTVDLLLTQVASRDVMADDDEEMEGEEDDDDDGDEGDEDEASRNGVSGESSSSSEGSESEEEEEEEESAEENLGGDDGVDPELRRRIAEALQMEDALLDDDDDEGSDSDGSSEDEPVMGDDEMMALDDKLAEIFRTSSITGRTARKGAQRQATLFKTRIVDFIETFAKRNPTSNYMLRAITPLVTLAALGSPEEADLMKKATRVIKASFGNEYINDLDATLAASTLKSVHATAKKARAVDVPAIFSTCCRYLIRNLSHADQYQLVRDQYKVSMDDYFTRKHSKFPLPILEDFVKRSPTCAWGLRDHIAQCCKAGGSAKVFGQLQAFDLLKELVLGVSVAKSETPVDIQSFIPTMLEAFCEALAAESKSSDTQMTAAQLRQVVQNLSAIVRKTMPKGEPWKDVQKLWSADGRLVSVAASLRETRPSPPLHQSLDAVLRLIGTVEIPNKKKRKPAAVNGTTEVPEEAEAAPQKKKKKRERQPSSP